MSTILATVLAAVAALTLTGPTTAQAATGDIGHADQTYNAVTQPPTADKPQSKLWYNDGLWWADMFDSASASWHIFRLNRATETWVDTGTPVDGRPQTSSDALWDGSKLYIGTQWVTISDDSTTRTSVAQPARLYRYSYSSSTKTYSLDSGFPTTISNSSSESLTIDKDTTGRIWATWTQVKGSSSAGYSAAVYVNSSATGTTWGTPVVIPASGANTSTAPDDISGVVAYGRSKIGVMWSNHLDNTVYWAVHNDGDAVGTWKGSVAVRGTKQADDHLNLKTIQSDTAGRVFAAVKTSLDELSTSKPTDPQINLLVFKPGTGSWSSTPFGTLADCHTRPLVMLDETNQQVHVFATAPTASGCPAAGTPGTIYEKSAPLDNPVFPSGRGTAVIRDAASAYMNNASSTKQSVTSASGLVVLASNNTTKRYWHYDEAIGGSTTTTPVAGFTASPTSGTAPLTVKLTDTSTGSPTSWAWNFGNGTSSTAQNPTATYSSAGTYSVTLTATNSAGTSAASKTITVTAAASVPTADFTSSTSSGTAPLAVSFTDTSSGSPTSWAWDFGNGLTSTAQNPSTTYASAGTYTVTLTATNSAGTSGVATKTVTVSAAPPSGAGIVRASTSTSEVTTAASTLTVPAPAGTSSGDLLVSCVATSGSSVSTAPTGWTRFTASTSTANPKIYGYYKVASAGEPSSYAWTLASSVTSSGGIARYTGATGIDGTATTASGASASSATVGGVTTSAAGAMVVGCMSVNSGSTAVTIAAPSGMTQAWDLGGKRQELDDAVQASAGATGSRTWTFSSGREWAGWVAALR